MNQSANRKRKQWRTKSGNQENQDPNIKKGTYSNKATNHKKRGKWNGRSYANITNKLNVNNKMNVIKTKSINKCHPKSHPKSLSKTCYPPKIQTDPAIQSVLDRLYGLFKSDDPRKILYRPEVFQINAVDTNCGRMSDKEVNVIRSRICEQYNPLFQSGCANRRCTLEHLGETRFLRFVKNIQTAKVPDIHAVRQFENALSAFQQRRYHDAMELLSALTNTYRYNAILQFWIARCHHSMAFHYRKMEFADLHYRRALAIQPGNGSFHAFYAQFSVDYGRALNQHGHGNYNGNYNGHYGAQQQSVNCSQYKQAKQHFKKSLNINHCAATHFCFAKFLDEVELQYPNAAFHYRHAIEGNPKYHRIRLNYARLLHKMGKLANSQKQFTKLMVQMEEQNLYLSSLWPHFHFARLLVDQQEYGRARNEFVICLDIMNRHQNRYFAEIYYEFAKLLHYHFGEHQLAMQYIQISLKHAPQRRIYRKLFYRLRHQEQRQEKETKEEWDGSQCLSVTPSVAPSVAVTHRGSVDMNAGGDVRGFEQNQDTAKVVGVGHEQTAPPRRSRPEPKTIVTQGFHQKQQNQDEADRESVGNFNTENGQSIEAKQNETAQTVARRFGNMTFGDMAMEEAEGKETSLEPEPVELDEHFQTPHTRKGGQQQPQQYQLDMEFDVTLITPKFIKKQKEPQNQFLTPDSEWIHFSSGNDDDSVILEDEDGVGVEDEECTAHFCRSAFDRFISEEDNFGPEFEEYYDRFEDEEMNDIRLLLTEKMMNADFLQKTIQMTPSSIRVWKKTVMRFKSHHKRYVHWMKKKGFYDDYYSQLEQFAILTLHAFFHHNRNLEDVVAIVGSRNEEDAKRLWRSARKETESTVV